jgi:hypothetical protein
MLPWSSDSANATVHIKSGTCSSVSYVLRCAPPITARPATSIATLRCETVTEQVGHRLTDALTHNRPAPQAPALIRESGQETVSGFASHRLLLVNHPWPLKGKIITREREYQCERRASYPAFHNIIPSELCNSRRHRQCPASREEVSRGQKPAKTAYRASDYTIRIMLRTLRRQGAEVLPSNSRVRRRRTRHSREGGTTPPSTRERRTLRILRRNVSASSGSAPPTCGNAARDFRFEARIRRKEVFVGAKCNHAYRQCCARVGSPLGAVVLCEQVRRLNRFARGRPGTSSRVSEQVCHTTSGTVPPR